MPDDDDDDIASYWEELRPPKEAWDPHQFVRALAVDYLQKTTFYLGLFDAWNRELDIPRELLYLGEDGVNTAFIAFQTITHQCRVASCGLFTTPDKTEGPLVYVPLTQEMFLGPGVTACFAAGSLRFEFEFEDNPLSVLNRRVR